MMTQEKEVAKETVPLLLYDVKIEEGIKMPHTFLEILVYSAGKGSSSSLHGDRGRKISMSF